MEESFEHIVEVDDYVEVKLKIPKRLTAMSLKALMTKATKLFNLAEIPIVSKRTYKRKSNGNKYNSPFTKESIADLKKWVDSKVPYKKIVERLKSKHNVEVSIKQAQMKVYNMKKRNQW